MTTRPCAVRGCIPLDSKRFSFPRTIEWAEKWREACANPKLNNVAVERLHTRFGICRRHFAKHQFTTHLMEKINLKIVPLLFLPPQDSLDWKPYISPDVSEGSSETLQPKQEKDVIIPPVERLDTLDSTVTNDEKTSSVYSLDEKGDFIEPNPSLPSNMLPCEQVFPDEKESEISQLESLRTKVNVVPINDYYRYTLCRLCFCFSDTLINIFDEGHECGFVISDAIKDLLQFKVSKADDYPQFICSSCLIKLGEFKEFKDVLSKQKETFEKALYKLRKSGGEGENDGVICEINPDSLIGVLENSKDAESTNHLSELEDTAEQNFSAESSECHDNSDPEDTCSEFEDTAMEKLLDSGAKTNHSFEQKDIILQEDYKCHDCGEVFKFINLLRKHINEHRKTWPFQCQYCDKRFKTLLDLNSHIVMHSDYKPYECEHCGLRCRTKGTLTRHKMTHSDEKPFLCSTCGMNFRDRLLLRNHLRMHSNINNYKCEDCGKEFRSGSRLRNHYGSHLKENPYVCGECGKSFRKGKSLSWHLTCIHSGEKLFKCELCGKRFSLKVYLNNHMKVHLKHALCDINTENIS